MEMSTSTETIVRGGVPTCLGIFTKAIFLVTISHAAISQISNFPSGKFPKVRLGLLRHPMLQWGGGLIAAARVVQGL